MNNDLINLIGIKEKLRKSASLANLKEVEGLSTILDQDFEIWSNIDSWGNMNAQQWVFIKALSVCKGTKLDIRCNCCAYSKLSLKDFKSNLNQNCYGLKIAYIVNKIVGEIKDAEVRRKNDGTYNG